MAAFASVPVMVVSFVLKRVTRRKTALTLIDREVDTMMEKESLILDALSADPRYTRSKTAQIRILDHLDIEEDKIQDQDPEAIEEDLTLAIEINAEKETIPLLNATEDVHVAQTLEKDPIVILVTVIDLIAIKDPIKEKEAEDPSVKVIQDQDLSQEVIIMLEIEKMEKQEVRDIEDLAATLAVEAEVDQIETEEIKVKDKREVNLEVIPVILDADKR